MLGIAIDLAKSILEKLIDATVRESQYICCFTCIAEDFEKEKETLKGKSSAVGQYVQVAKNNGESIRSDVIQWHKQVEDLINEDTKTKVTCFFGWCPNCKWRYSRGKDLKTKSEEMKRHIIESSNYISNVVGIQRGVAGVEYYSSQDYISFESRKSSYKELWDALTNYNNYMTGLQGMGGTGKTILAKEVGKELKKSKKFDHVIDTTVSSTPDIKKIQDDIAKPLGLSFNDCTESERPKILWSRLIDGEKILIILDDVWRDIKFEQIGIPLKDNHNGCKILVTTRDLKICNKMKCDRKIQLNLLPDEDAWTLFKTHAGISQSSSESILEVGRKIVKECKGLPVAIAVIARSLNGEEGLEEWKLALEALQNFIPQHGDDKNLDEIHKCLKYSYDNMRNETAKRLFLLCSMFPEDEELCAEILLRCSIGAVLVEEIDNNYDGCRNQVVVANNILIDSCLLLKTEEGSAKMHDLVREVALIIASNEIQAMNISNKNKKSLDGRYNPKYLVCEGNGMYQISSMFDRSKLQILIIYVDGDITDSVEGASSFFENMTGLRVLYLSRKTLTNRSLSLPQSIKSLTNIQSLILEGFHLGDISIVGNLQSLESLDLVRCSMNELPSEIEQLKKLKLLLLKKCYIRQNNPFIIIGNCSSLEELHFVDNHMSTIHHKNINLPKFHRFHIEYFGMRDNSPMNSMYFERADEIFSKTTIKHLVGQVELLNLQTGGWRNIIPEIIQPGDEGTLNLVKLSLSHFPQLEFLVDNNEYVNHPIQNVFSKLVELALCDMENFKELCSGSLPVQLLKSLETLLIYNCRHLQGVLFKSMFSLYKLKYLSLTCCPMLTSLCQLCTTQSLVLLEDLDIAECAELKYIFYVDSDNEKKSSRIVFPNLKMLRIQRCPKLDFILPVVAAQDVPKLEFISIRNCLELRYIFSPHQGKHKEQDLHQGLMDSTFVMLKEVHLVNLPKFVNFFANSDSYMERSCYDSNTQIESIPIKCNIFCWSHKHRPKLRNKRSSLDSRDHLQDHSLPLVHDSQNNDVIVHMLVELVNFQWSSISCFSLQHITILQIRDCEKMKVVFSASMLRCLPQLQFLYINNCNELEQIIEEETSRNQTTSLLPSLKLLYIEKCNNLKCVFPISTYKVLPKLEFFIVNEASMLEQVFKCGIDKKIEIPNLKVVAFVELPSLCKDVDEFHTVKDRLVVNCPKFSLTSTLTHERIDEIVEKYGIEGTDQTNRFFKQALDWFDYICEQYKAQKTNNQYSDTKLEGSDLTSLQESKKTFEEGATSDSAQIIASPTTCSETDIDNEIILETTVAKEPTPQAKEKESTFNSVDGQSSSSSSEDKQEVQGNKGLNSSTPALSEHLNKYHIQVDSNKLNNMGILKYTPIDIDDCHKHLDDDPFVLLDFFSHEISLSSKQSKTKVEESSMSETLASALDELRQLTFSLPMLENIGKVEYREKVEAVIRKLEMFPNDIDQDLDERIRSFIKFFEKAVEVCQKKSSTIELIKQVHGEKKEALEKLQRTKDKVCELVEVIEKYKPELENIEKRQRELKDTMKKAQEELNELGKDKEKIESASTKYSSKKAELLESAKYVSDAIIRNFKHLTDLEENKAKHDADFEALKEPYNKMKVNPPF